MKTIRVHIHDKDNAAVLHCPVGTILTMSMRDYLYGVNPQEMGYGRIEAQRAQAIAARSYAFAGAVLSGGAISDGSGTAQAYNAAKARDPAYEQARQAVRDTEGIILTYNWRPVKTHYTHSNGGRIRSALEAWGGDDIPYEISKGDPWDLAIGETKNGHGVGMSQNGARYAAELGKSHEEILAFYYPGTILMADYGRKEMNTVADNTRIDKMETKAISRVGDPYIFATSGQKCTPGLRKERAAAKPDYAAKIYQYCPVLSEKQSSCSGCKWEDRHADDCRGFTWEIADEFGIDMTSIGADSQWHDDCWDAKGTIENIPEGMLCVVFREDQKNPGHMKHTGLCLRDGSVIDARGHAQGIVRMDLHDFPWTHYAIWYGLYEAIELPESEYVITPADPEAKLPTLRKGSEGERVAEMQRLLMDLGYDLGTWGADGNFGNQTLAAVKAFQKDHGLITDGKCGPITWGTLQLAAGNVADEEQDDQDAGEPVAIILWTATLTGLTTPEKDSVLAAWPGATARQQD